jgi:hypothetical protein
MGERTHELAPPDVYVHADPLGFFLVEQWFIVRSTVDENAVFSTVKLRLVAAPDCVKHF